MKMFTLFNAHPNFFEKKERAKLYVGATCSLQYLNVQVVVVSFCELDEHSKQ